MSTNRPQPYIEQQAMGNDAVAGTQALIAQSSLLGIGPLYTPMFLTQQKIPEPVVYGEILRAGSPIQEWRGAEFQYGNRAICEHHNHRYWKINFISPYCSDLLCINLNADTHSGEDADRIAKTMLEALNQRRLG